MHIVFLTWVISEGVVLFWSVSDKILSMCINQFGQISFLSTHIHKLALPGFTVTQECILESPNTYVGKKRFNIFWGLLWHNNSSPANTMTSFSGDVLTSNFPEINAISYFFKNINISIDFLDTDLWALIVTLCNGIRLFQRIPWTMLSLFTLALNLALQLHVV